MKVIKGTLTLPRKLILNKATVPKGVPSSPVPPRPLPCPLAH